jgi:hypothetical protein
MNEDAAFNHLGDAAKIEQVVETELPAALATIDDALARLAASRTEEDGDA